MPKTYINKKNTLLNNRVVFPIGTASLIKNVLKKYGLSETAEEIIEKIEKHQVSSSVLAADLTKQIATDTISSTELISTLKKDLSLSANSAKRLAEEIKEIAALSQESPEAVSQSLTEKTPPTAKPGPQRRDPYRESAI